MPVFRGTRLALLGGRQSYIDKVLSHGPIAYWPMNEPSGSVSEELVSGMDGAYTGVTLGQPGIGDGNTCPLFDGSTDYNNIYSAALAAAFSGSEGALMLWCKVYDSSVWTATTDRALISIKADVSNQILVYRNGAPANRLTYYYAAGGTTDVYNYTSPGDITWFTAGITWSKTAGATGEVKSYYNGIQVGTTQESLGTWVGTPASTTTLIGATATTPTLPWYGWLGHGALWDRPLSAAAMLDLATL